MSQQHFFDPVSKQVIACSQKDAESSWIAMPESDALALATQMQPKPSQEEVLLDKIARLEAKVTPRRIREAVLTGDKTFIQDTEDKITALRQKLEALK